MSKRQDKRPILSVEEETKSASKKQRSSTNINISSASSPTPAIAFAAPATALITPPRHQRSLRDFESPQSRQINELLRVQAASKASGITFDSTDDLKNWLQTNSTPENPAETPMFNFQGVVVGFTADVRDGRCFNRLYLWGGAATEDEVETFLEVFNPLLLNGHRLDCQRMVLTLTVWNGLNENTFNNRERVTVKNVKRGSLYCECPQGSVSNVVDWITRV